MSLFTYLFTSLSTALPSTSKQSEKHKDLVEFMAFRWDLALAVRPRDVVKSDASPGFIGGGGGGRE